MSEKKIPRAIKQSLLTKLQKIDPNINKALERLLHANLREPEPNSDSMKDLAIQLWPYLKKKIEFIVDQAIEDTKRGCR